MQHQQQSHFRTVFLTSFSVGKSNFDSDYFPNWWKKTSFCQDSFVRGKNRFPTHLLTLMGLEFAQET